MEHETRRYVATQDLRRGKFADIAAKTHIEHGAAKNIFLDQDERR